MTNKMDTLQKYFAYRATEKARIKNVQVNGNRATVVFSEYKAPESDVEEFRKQNGTDGHYYYIIMYIWNGVKSYWNDKEISTEYVYMTTKEEGNEIYKQIKATGKFDYTE